MQTTSEHASQAISAERRLKELGIHLLVPPEPFGTCSETVRGRLHSLSERNLADRGAYGQVRWAAGSRIDAAAGIEAARLAAMNTLAIARQRLGSLDRVKRIVRLASAWRQKEMFATSQRLRTERPPSSKRCLAQTKTLRARCMASRVFHLEPLSRWS